MKGGEKVKAKTIKFKCLNCKKIFEVKEPEATEIEGDCPFCGSMNIRQLN